MKKVLSITMLLLGIMLVLSCASKPITTQEEADAAFRKVYNMFRGDLILEGAETYEVVSGDTLSAIAREKYPSGYYYPLIMLASSDVVVDPDLIDPGMELTVPDLQKNLDNARAKGRLKNFLIEIAKIEERRDRADTAKGIRDLSASL